jgi:hypothetical protein
MKRHFQHKSFDQNLFKNLLTQHALLRDELIIEASILEHQDIDTSPLGNTDPDVLLRNLEAVQKRFTYYRRKVLWLPKFIDDGVGVFFDCKINGQPARTYEDIAWIKRKLEQDSRLKKLAVGFADFFRTMDISVGKDSILQYIRQAEEYVQQEKRNAPLRPNPAKRPVRRKKQRIRLKDPGKI